jgi:hypothetical protein
MTDTPNAKRIIFFKCMVFFQKYGEWSEFLIHLLSTQRASLDFSPTATSALNQPAKISCRYRNLARGNHYKNPCEENEQTTEIEYKEEGCKEKRNSRREK